MTCGGVSFAHVWAFQIKGMMANQYDALVRALEEKKKEGVLIACLRLGWNDAFRRVSENVEGLDEKRREEETDKACNSLVKSFKEYAVLQTSGERQAWIEKAIANSDFLSKFKDVKVIDAQVSDKAVCFGHVQKIFNMAMKLLLCLILSAEHAKENEIDVVLDAAEGRKVLLTEGNLLTFEEFPYAFDTADCPLDSRILEQVKGDLKEKRDIVWSKIGHKGSADVYLLVQEAIAEKKQGENKSNLCFDFEHWNKQ